MNGILNTIYMCVAIYQECCEVQWNAVGIGYRLCKKEGNLNPSILCDMYIAVDI